MIIRDYQKEGNDHLLRDLSDEFITLFKGTYKITKDVQKVCFMH